MSLILDAGLAEVFRGGSSVNAVSVAEVMMASKWVWVVAMVNGGDGFGGVKREGCAADLQRQEEARVEEGRAHVTHPEANRRE